MKLKKKKFESFVVVVIVGWKKFTVITFFIAAKMQRKLALLLFKNTISFWIIHCIITKYNQKNEVHCESSVNEILIKFSCTYLIYFFSVRSLCWKDSFFYVINVQRKKIVDGRGNKWRRYERKVQFFHLIPPHSLKNATKTERE